ncbi:DUF3618 domain-containing protein [soil metagenome]
MDDRPDQLGGRDIPSEGSRAKLSRERAEINPNPADTDDEIGELRQELARTRAEMSETIYILQGRMNPDYVREQASSQAKATAKQAGSNVAETIRDNPIPAALAGAGLVGLGWLIASGRDSGSQHSSPRDFDASNYYDSRRSYYRSFNDEPEYEASTGSSGGERAQEAAGQARDKAGELGEQLQSRASQAGGEAQEKAQRAKGGLQRTLQESPLALGALALGIGAAVGFAVPGSSKEDEVMGETRDNLVERGKQSAHDARQRAQRAIEEGRRAAEQEADRQDLT